MTFEKTILSFREYAGRVLKEQTDQVTEFDNTHYLSGKLARLKFVNAHLKILKDQLATGVQQVLSEHTPAGNNDKLSVTLQNISQEHINEFMYIGFTKDK